MVILGNRTPFVVEVKSNKAVPVPPESANVAPPVSGFKIKTIVFVSSPE